MPKSLGLAQPELAEVFCWWFGNDIIAVSQLRREWSGAENSWNKEMSSSNRMIRELKRRWFESSAIDDDSVFESVGKLVDSSFFRKNFAKTYKMAKRKQLLPSFSVNKTKQAPVWERLAYIIVYLLMRRDRKLKQGLLNINKARKMSRLIAAQFLESGEISRMAPQFQIPILLALQGSKNIAHTKLVRAHVRTRGFRKMKVVDPFVQELFT